jgi:signal transduction histidine kinase
VTSVGRIVNTTAFRLSALYFVVFSAFAVFFVVYVTYSTNQLLNRQVSETIETEFRGLADQWNSGGLIGMMNAIEFRSRQPGASLYLLTDATGQALAGNVAQMPAALLTSAVERPVTLPYQAEGGTQRQAMVQVARLPGGFNLLVGRDIAERDRFTEIVQQAIGLAVALMIVLGVIGWFFVSRRVLQRIDSITATSRRIMEGDLSGRLDVIGTGDEFDRLAASLNVMLGRIEHLMTGLKEVSDNIAHDLKTPLTRMRNRLETAVAADPKAASREVLEATIEEADQLIRTFDALLMIARVEAGAPADAEVDVDLAGIVGDIAELYEPVAEEAGVALAIDAAGPLPLKGSRELLSQALANLVDNAIKYAHAAPDETRQAAVSIRAWRDGDAMAVSVADNGPGVPEADRERVLERFVRLEKSRSEPGSGLGLSLVAAVVHLHGGSITLGDNNPGLLVTLRLPMKAANA